MKERFTFDFGDKKFEVRVSYLPRLIGADHSPITELYENIINDFLLNPVHEAKVLEAVRTEDKGVLEEIKNNSPSAILQCVVKNGVDKKDIVVLNHIVVVDVDFPNRPLVEIAFPILKMLFGGHCLALYRSISGRGIHVVILIPDPDKKEESYNRISSILKSHHFPVDDCFKNVVQKAVLSYDPNGYYNSSPTPFEGTVDPDIEKQVRELTGRKAKSKKSSDDEKESPKQKAMRFIAANYALTRNLLTYEVELNRIPISDYEINSITMDCNEAGINVEKTWVASYLGSNKVRSYHPLLELVDLNKGRDDYKGTIDKVAACIIPEDGNRLDHNIFFKKWRVKGVAQIFEPYVTNEYCPIIIGPPGIGKTYFLTGLYDGELERYTAVLPIVKTNDFSIELINNLQITDDEYRTRKLDDENYFKSVLSLRKVKVRRPYDITPVHRKRIASFCASSNDCTILKDTNRRVIPILVKGFKWEEFNSISKTDLFLDSYALYKSGFDYNLTKEESELLKEVSKDFEITNVEEEALLLFFPKAHSLEAADEFLTVSQMISLANIYGKVSLTPHRVTQILNRHRYHHKTITVHSSKTGEKTSRLRGWAVKQVDFVSIAQLFMAKDLTARKYTNVD